MKLRLTAGALLAALLFVPRAPAAAPGSVAHSLYLQATQSFGAGGGYTTTLTLLRADGTFQQLHVLEYSNITRTSTYQYAASGSFTYTVSQADPTRATLTTTVPVELVFDAEFSGLVYGIGGLTTFRLYPAQPESGAVNVSNRAWVSASRPAITGFVVGGSRERWVLLRAVGPSLAAFDVPTVVSQPAMSLFRGSSLQGTYGSWSAEPALVNEYTTMMAIAGAFSLPAGSADSVALVRLAPGAYTVQSGAATTDAEILMEAYMLPFAGPAAP